MYEYMTLALSLAALLLAAKWQRAKRKFHAAVEALAAVDRAVMDDRVTESDFREVWEKFKAVLDDADNPDKPSHEVIRHA